MVNRMTTAAAAMAVALAVVAAFPAMAAEDDTWKLEFAPYIWGAGVDADVKVRGRSASINRSFSDIAKNLDMAGAFVARGQYNNWVTRAQVDYLDLSSNLDRPSGSLDSKVTMSTLAFGYQFKPTTRMTIDALLGARYLSLDNKLQLDAVGTLKGNRNYTDPIVMLQPRFQLSKQWAFDLELAYGAGGDTDYTYEVQPQLEYQPWSHVALRAGYRLLHYKIKSGQDEFDGAFEGPFIGVGIVFGSAPKAVAAPPPPEPAPVAVAPPPPADTDNDGVADTDDQCPNTPAGQRVDSVGCGYEIRVSVHFNTDSATIRSDSYESLDRVVDLLKRVPTMRGVIEGYTDSTGSAAYNQALSERRAAAVSDYLVAHGIDASRVPWKGYGESDPIADNATAEGRAMNRRVVLRRTDRQD